MAAILARRILSDARRLRFDRDGRTLSVSLSIGVAHNRHEESLSFDTLVGVAEEGLAVAQAAGGDRFVETELYQIYERQRAEKARRERRRASDAEAPPAPFGSQAPGVSEERRLLEILAAAGWRGESLRNIDPEVLSRALREVIEEGPPSPGQGVDEMADARGRIDVLERRIAKLTHLLGVTEEELKRVAAMKGVDLGLASIYRGVQGLSSEAAQREAKRAMMREIFEANVEMRRRIGREGERSPGGG